MENEEMKNNSSETLEEVVGETSPISENPENGLNDSEPKENPMEGAASTEVEEKKKKKKKGPILIIILLLLIAAGCAYYFLVFNKEVKTIENDVKEVESEYRMSGNSLEKFDLYFLKLENEEKNKVYSPLSIKYALEMLAEGANGETKAQLDAVIGDYKAKKYNNNEHMSFANAMFIRDTFKDKVKEEYTNQLSEKYNAEINTDPFTEATNINNWIKEKTLNLIPDLLSDDDVRDANFYLINALAIDMNWNNQIHCAQGHSIPCIGYDIDYLHEILDDNSKSNYSVTEYPYSSEDDFYRTDNKGSYRNNEFNGKENIKGATVLADFNKYDIIKELGEDNIREMIKPEYEQWLQTEDGKNDLPVDQFLDKFINELKENYGKSANSTDFLVNEDDNIKAFAKNLQTYDGTTLQYVGIMPKNEELSEFIKNTDVEELNKIINDLKEVNIDSFEEGYATRIRGFIPFFKFEYELQLMEDLKQLEIKDVFDSSKADLSKLTDSKSIYIEKAIHKANIEFSNDGIKASAVTAEGGAGAAHGPYFEHLFKIPVKEIDVTFNKPYMYLIRDKETGEVWFTGTIYEPIQK